MRFSSLLLVILMAQSHGALYKVDPVKSMVKFSIIKFKIGAPVEGTFTKFSGRGDYNSQTKTLNSFSATIVANSINTQNKDRDDHIKKDAGFFDVAKYPDIIFKSSKPVVLKKGEVTIPGILTIKGVEKGVDLVGEVIVANEEKMEIKAKATINRLDYGVTWNKALEKSKWTKVFGKLGKTVLDDSVELNVVISARK